LFLVANLRTLDTAFPAPDGFARVAEPDGSFGAYLRTLPLLPPGSPVVAFDGSIVHKGDDARIAAVVDLDVGTRDLQQCADSIMRLWAEYLRAEGRTSEIKFRTADDDWIAYRGWKGSWHAFLDKVFDEANTGSLLEQGKPVAKGDLVPGDFVVMTGNPFGHAVLVLDVVADRAGHRKALLGQGYMPAQSFQVLAHDGDPWFSLDGDSIDTPFWVPFPWSALRRF
jgi:hypothetical protein